MTNPPIIRLNHVVKQYDDVTAINDVSLTVNQGELLVLLGNSGCGKTTLLRLVAGLERPNDGEVLLDGELVADQNTFLPPEQRHIGMVFQDYALFPHMSIGQNVEFALKGVRGSARKQRVEDMLDLVGLAGLGKRFPHQLSGGQQQRVALARALAPEPSVVLLDEPFSNLDAALRKFMRDEVRRILRAAGATAIFVTHDQEEAMSIADRVAVLQAGRLLQVGTPRELYRRPRVRGVATFLGEANMVQGTAHGSTVDTPLGALPLGRPTEGDVEVMIRPEAITLTVNDITGAATVANVRYFGHYQLVRLDIGDDIAVDARVWAQEPIEVGQSVSIAVQGEVVAFPLVTAENTIV